MDEDDGKSYRWETEYEKTWYVATFLAFFVPANLPFYLYLREAIKEDESGRIQSSVDEIVYKSIRKRILNQKNVRLGMVSTRKTFSSIRANLVPFVDATFGHNH